MKTPIALNVSDLIDKTNRKSAPYGVYDATCNKGWTSVAVNNDGSS
jgi:hypothetical protein